MMNNSPENIEDRRRQRSEDPELAIGYQLERVVEDFNLECCLIVDESGTTIATSPDSPTPLMQRFAAMLPTMATVTEHRDEHLKQLREVRSDLGDDDLTACVFRAGGRRLFIGAVGPEAVMNEMAIFRAITGARRIHGSDDDQ